jgi:hypothetical protein
MGPRGKTLSVGVTPLIVVRLLLEVQVAAQGRSYREAGDPRAVDRPPTRPFTTLTEVKVRSF